MKILIVMDMQNDFIDGPLGTAEAQRIVPAVVEKIRQYNTVIATRDTHHADYLNTQEGKYLPVVHCVQGTAGWKIASAVAAVLPKDTQTIDKAAFASTDLVATIGDYVATYGQSALEIEIIGLCTDICVVSNALMLKGFYPEISICVDAKCCAGITVESHEAALLTMSMCQIVIAG